MEFLKRVLELLDAEMETPTAFGWFHLLFIALTVGGAAVLCLLHKKDDPDRVRRIVFITAIVVIALEIYKQINYSFSYSGEVIEFDYQWYAFPFQFCSTPSGYYQEGKSSRCPLHLSCYLRAFRGCVRYGLPGGRVHRYYRHQYSDHDLPRLYDKHRRVSALFGSR